MKKDLAIIFGLFILIVALLAFGQGLTSVGFLKDEGGQTQTNVRQKGSVDVGIKTLNVKAKVASKPSDRKKGLSNLDSLPLSEGMLFVFENKGTYSFWMKDMKFAIDIIWLDESKRVVDLAVNVPPEPGRDEDELTMYRPSFEALYVLEINAGLSQLHNIQIGDPAYFEL